MANLSNTVCYPDGHDPPKHILEGIFSGVSEASGTAWHGMHTAMRQPLRYAASEGLIGAGKGLVVGVATFAEGVADGFLDLASYVVEGTRNTPEAVADYMLGQDRAHYRHGVDRAEGRMLETFLTRQPRHLPDGIVLGSKAVAKGVVSGTSCLIAENMQIADRTYLAGASFKDISKGVASGFAGFTAKAAASGLDVTEAVVDGARNTPDFVRHEVFKGMQIAPQRLVSTGLNAVVTAAHKAGALENAMKEHAQDVWHNRPKLTEIQPMGAHAAQSPGQRSASREGDSPGLQRSATMKTEAPASAAAASRAGAGPRREAGGGSPPMQRMLSREDGMEVVAWGPQLSDGPRMGRSLSGLSQGRGPPVSRQGSKESMGPSVSRQASKASTGPAVGRQFSDGDSAVEKPSLMPMPCSGLAALLPVVPQRSDASAVAGTLGQVRTPPTPPAPLPRSEAAGPLAALAAAAVPEPEEAAASQAPRPPPALPVWLPGELRAVAPGTPAPAPVAPPVRRLETIPWDVASEVTMTSCDRHSMMSTRHSVRPDYAGFDPRGEWEAAAARQFAIPVGMVFPPPAQTGAARPSMGGFATQEEARTAQYAQMYAEYHVGYEMPRESVATGVASRWS